MKKTFILKSNWIEIFDELSDKQAGLLIKSLYYYNVTGEKPGGLSDEVVKAYLNMMILDCKEFSESYDRRKDTSRENGSLGGAPMGNTNASRKQPKNNLNNLNKQNNPNDNDNVNENDHGGDARAKPPPDSENHFALFCKMWDELANDESAPVKAAKRKWSDIAPDIVIRPYLDRYHEYGKETVLGAINKLRNAKYWHGRTIGMQTLLDMRTFAKLIDGEYDTLFANTQNKPTAKSENHKSRIIQPDEQVGTWSWQNNEGSEP